MIYRNYGAGTLKTSNIAPPLKFLMHVLRSIMGLGGGYSINKIIDHMMYETKGYQTNPGRTWLVVGGIGKAM